MNEDTSSSSDDDFLEYLLDDDDDNEDDKRLFLILLGSTSVRGCEMESPAIGCRSSFYVRERLEWVSFIAAVPLFSSVCLTSSSTSVEGGGEVELIRKTRTIQDYCELKFFDEPPQCRMK